jgi:murein DD-endopeptidase MepM/ murein hydrolase activator NlpD
LYSPEGGKVVNTGDRSDTGWGKFVTVQADANQDGQNIYILYAHLNKVNVRIGQSISEEEKIGETGVSGNASRSK